MYTRSLGKKFPAIKKSLTNAIPLPSTPKVVNKGHSANIDDFLSHPENPFNREVAGKEAHDISPTPPGMPDYLILSGIINNPVANNTDNTKKAYTTVTPLQAFLRSLPEHLLEGLQRNGFILSSGGGLTETRYSITPLLTKEKASNGNAIWRWRGYAFGDRMYGLTPEHQAIVDELIQRMNDENSEIKKSTTPIHLRPNQTAIIANAWGLLPDTKTADPNENKFDGFHGVLHGRIITDEEPKENLPKKHVVYLSKHFREAFSKAVQSIGENPIKNPTPYLNSKKLKELFPIDVQEKLKIMGKTGDPGLLLFDGSPNGDAPSNPTTLEAIKETCREAPAFLYALTSLLGENDNRETYTIQKDPLEQSGSPLHFIAPKDQDPLTRCLMRVLVKRNPNLVLKDKENSQSPRLNMNSKVIASEEDASAKRSLVSCVDKRVIEGKPLKAYNKLSPKPSWKKNTLEHFDKLPPKASTERAGYPESGSSSHHLNNTSEESINIHRHNAPPPTLSR